MYFTVHAQFVRIKLMISPRFAHGGSWAGKLADLIGHGVNGLSDDAVDDPSGHSVIVSKNNDWSSTLVMQRLTIESL